MTKERELLRRVVDIIEENPTQADQYAINLIEAFLAEPEPEKNIEFIELGKWKLVDGAWHKSYEGFGGITLYKEKE